MRKGNQVYIYRLRYIYFICHFWFYLFVPAGSKYHLASYFYSNYNSAPTNLLCAFIVKYITFLCYRSNDIILHICLYNSCLNQLRKENANNMHFFCLDNYIITFRSALWFYMDLNFHLDMFAKWPEELPLVLLVKKVWRHQILSFYLLVNIFVLYSFVKGILLYVRILVDIFLSFNTLPMHLAAFWPLLFLLRSQF